MSADIYVIHPDYNALTLDNDVGLIWLRLPVTFSGLQLYLFLRRIIYDSLVDYLKPVDFLPFGDLSDYSSAYAIGWGQVGDRRYFCQKI